MLNKSINSTNVTKGEQEPNPESFHQNRIYFLKQLWLFLYLQLQSRPAAGFLCSPSEQPTVDRLHSPWRIPQEYFQWSLVDRWVANAFAPTHADGTYRCNHRWAWPKPSCVPLSPGHNNHPVTFSSSKNNQVWGFCIETDSTLPQ